MKHLIKASLIAAAVAAAVPATALAQGSSNDMRQQLDALSRQMQELERKLAQAEANSEKAVKVAEAKPKSEAASVQVYGRAHISVDYLDDGARYGEANMSSNSSRLGFKAEKKTASGITGFMQIEGEITYNQGDSSLSSRDTFVGIKGDFGSLRAGKFDTPFKTARGPANLFGDQLGDMRNLTRVDNGRFDERTPNTLHYQTPSFGGFQANLAYSMHEGTYEGHKYDDQGYSLSLTYKGGPVDVAVAYEKYEEDYSRGERDAVRAAIAYKVIDPLKLVAFAQKVDHDVQDHLDSKTYGLGAEFAVTKNTYLKGMYLVRNSDADEQDSDMIAVGIEHRLDRALRVYLNYAVVDNEDDVRLTPWAQGRSTNAPGAWGEEAKGLSLGLRYDF